MKPIISKTIITMLIASSFFMVNCQKSSNRKVKAQVNKQAKPSVTKTANCTASIIDLIKDRQKTIAEMETLIAEKDKLDAAQKQKLKDLMIALTAKSEKVVTEIRKLKVGTAAADSCNEINSVDPKKTMLHAIADIIKQDEIMAAKVKAIVEPSSVNNTPVEVVPLAPTHENSGDLTSAQSSSHSEDRTRVVSQDQTRTAVSADSSTVIISDEHSFMLGDRTRLVSGDSSRPASGALVVVTSGDASIVSQDRTLVASADVTSGDATTVDDTLIEQGQILEVAGAFGQYFDRLIYGNEKIVLVDGQILSSRDKAQEIAKLEEEKNKSFCAITAFAEKIANKEQVTVTALTSNDNGADVSLSKRDILYGLSCKTIGGEEALETEIRKALGALVKVVKNAPEE